MLGCLMRASVGDPHICPRLIACALPWFLVDSVESVYAASAALPVLTLTSSPLRCLS